MNTKISNSTKAKAIAYSEAFALSTVMALVVNMGLKKVVFANTNVKGEAKMAKYATLGVLVAGTLIGGTILTSYWENKLDKKW